MLEQVVSNFVKAIVQLGRGQPQVILGGVTFPAHKVMGTLARACLVGLKFGHMCAVVVKNALDFE